MIPERKILVITGAGGFLGKGLIRVLEGMYTLRLVDIRDFETPHEKRIGDVADLDFCMEVMKGAHLLLIAHMSPRPYDTPYGPFSEEAVMVVPSDSEVLVLQGSLYAPMTHEKWQEQNGKVFYIVLSVWMPVYNPSVYRVVLK